MRPALSHLLRVASSPRDVCSLLVTTPYADEAFFRQLLAKAIAAKASDVHLKVGQPPGARIRGDMIYFKTEPINAEDTEAVARIVLSGSRAKEQVDEIYEHDGSYFAP